MPGWVRVAARADVPERGLLAVRADEERICLVSTGDGGLYALKDRCTHADFPLSDGEIMSDNKRLECKYHGAKFDVASGRAVALPAIRPVQTYPVKIEGEDVLVELE
ncbi:MAG TPA: non-heme iron oxygenase ferredoxin subunit [Longimicrobiales bacterium]|nr:non-heme iron oxygenase ferredoxin subunit [Longimicrobiales bacterium]